MLSEPTHEVRNGINVKARSFRLHDDRLSWLEAGRTDECLFADIATVQLIAYPGYGGEQFQCTLINHAGKKLKIHSHHYVSLGLFEDRTKTYGAFVRALTARLADKSGRVAFHHGSGMFHAAWTVLFWLSLVIVVLFLLSLFRGERPGMNTIVPFLIMLSFVPIARRQTRRSISGTFDPAAPPGTLLGDKS